MAESYDVIIIGSGPGGYVAAIRSAQLGFKTAIVEREHLAGICSNWGCIPTKALLRSAEIFHYAGHAKNYGLKIEGTVTADLKAIVDRSRGIAQRMNGGVGFLMKKNKVDVIWGEATLTKANEIVVAKTAKKPMEPQAPLPKNTKGEGTYTARHIVIATGARPRALPGIEPDGKLIWTYFEAMVPKEMPKSLLVMGSGAIGIEFASFYRTMGVEVTVVELLPAVMPVEDAEISAFAKKQFEKQGMKIILEAKVTKVEKSANSITAHVEKKDGSVEKITADRMISAVGVQGNIENLGLEALGVKTDRGTIVVDGYGNTNVAGLYAIGDVAGPPMLAHKAEHEAVICVEKIAGLPGVHPLDKLEDPRLHLLQPASGVGRPDRGQGQGGRLRHPRRPFPLRRQRQGDRARRGPGHGQDDLRQEDRPAARRPYGRRRGDRADPGFRRRHEPRDHRGRADAHDLPAPDAVGDDEGERARRLRTCAQRIERMHRRACFHGHF